MSVPLVLGVVAGPEDAPIGSHWHFFFHPRTLEPPLPRSTECSAFVSSCKAVCSFTQNRSIISRPKRT